MKRVKATTSGKKCAQHFWAKVIGQDSAVRSLTRALDAGKLAHAYLLVGPQGLGKINAARAVAAALMCPEGGCGTCTICTRLERNTHPDFRLMEPTGAGRYLIEQIRQLNYEVNLAPVEAAQKIYVMRDADLFNAASANAFLKTLEEPTASTVFILLAHTPEAVLPTIASRCQILRFHPLSPEAAATALYEKTGTEGDEARIALAASGNIVAAARDYLRSPKQQEARAMALRVFRDLPTADELDVLDLARDLLRCALEPVEELRQTLEAELLERAELLDPVALKELERYNKRRLSAFEERCLTTVLNVFASLLADALTLASTPAGSTTSTTPRPVNLDARAALDALPPLSPAALTRGQESIALARRRLAAHVGSTLLMEAVLFDIREVVI